MAGTTAQQANGKRAAIYARVSDKSQDGEDKTSISEQTSEMEAYCEGKGLTITAPLPGGRQGLVKEASRVPEDGDTTSETSPSVHLGSRSHRPVGRFKLFSSAVILRRIH